MDWRKQAKALYRLAGEQGLGAHPQVLAFLHKRSLPAEFTESAATAAAAQGAVSGQTAFGGTGRGTAATSFGIACSGGADSLALLLWLYGAWQEGEGSVLSRALRTAALPTVLHLNHGLRGEHSRGDAQFVSEVAAALGWPLFAQTAEAGVRGTAGVGGTCSGGAGLASVHWPVNEDTLRQWRQTFFERSGCGIIFQGHHRGDVAETLLMRVSRGSGLEGLCAPRAVSERGAGRPAYLRPLLDWSKAQITGLLQELRIPWREDASNARGDYFRNRVRLTVLPALAQAAPERDVEAAAALTRQRLEEDAEALAAWLDQLWPSLCRAPVALAGQATASGQQTVGEMLPPATALQWSLAAPLPRAMRRRLLWRFFALHNLEATFTRPAVDAMLDALETVCTATAGGVMLDSLEAACAVTAGGALRFSAGRDCFVQYSHDSGLLELVCAATAEQHGLGALAEALSRQPLVLTPGSTVYLPHGCGSVGLELVRLDEALRSAIRSGHFPCSGEAYLALDAAGESPTACCASLRLGLRLRRAGDAYRPLGSPGRRKLQDIFIDKKVPRALRDLLPVVTDLQTDVPLWVVGLPPADSRAVTSRTKWALRLTYMPCRKTVSLYLI